MFSILRRINSKSIVMIMMMKMIKVRKKFRKYQVSFVFLFNGYVTRELFKRKIYIVLDDINSSCCDKNIA